MVSFFKNTFRHSSISSGESQGQWSLAGLYSPWGHKESDVTENAYTGIISNLEI